MTTKKVTVRHQYNQQTAEPEVTVFLDDIRVTSISKFDPKLITMYGTSVIDESREAAIRELRYWALSDEQIEQVLVVVMEYAPKQASKIVSKTYTPIPKPTNQIERELQEIGLTTEQYDRILKIISKYNLME